MRIEGNRPNPEGVAAQKLDRALAENSRSATETANKPASLDRVELSTDAALANRAVKAAEEAPEIRPAVVDRARRLLAAGELGKDAHALADRLIDSMLDQKK